MKLAAYIRVSTDKQGEFGHSLADQETEIRRWAAANGHEIVGEVYQDIVSSRNIPKLRRRDAAITDVEAGLAEGIVAKDLDRFSRGIFDGITQVKRATENHWVLLTLDGTNTADPELEMLTNIKFSVAQEVRRKISKSTKAGLRQAVLDGVTLGRPRSVAAAVVTRIMAEHEAGGTYSGIARDLTADAIPTPAGAVKWYPATVRDVVLREAS